MRWPAPVCSRHERSGTSPGDWSSGPGTTRRTRCRAARPQTARAKASDSYDTLAAHGKEALDGQSSDTQGKSTTGAQSKPELNGKAKAPTRSTTSK